MIGTHEIANYMFSLKSIFKDQAISVDLSVNKLYAKNKYDYAIKSKNKYLTYIVRIFYGPYLLAKLSNQADVFIYIWSTGFCLDREIDYKFLKKKKKKIVCIFLGSDIRSHKLRIDHHTKNDLDTGSNYTAEIINILKTEIIVKKVALLADQYADLIFGHPKDQPSYLKSVQHPVPYIYGTRHSQCNEEKFNNLDEIIVVHASTSPVTKGTPLVRAAIKKLKIEGYRFKYIELFDAPNEDLLKTLEKSHIVLSQFYAFALGVFSVEGMAYSNAVITSADYDGFSENKKTAWLRTKYWEVYENTKYLLDNPEKIKKYAHNGFKFVKKNFREEQVKKYYIETFYDNKIIDDKNI